MSTRKLFKILTMEDYRCLKTTGLFQGNNLDVINGYIHLSGDESQYRQALDKYYRNQNVYLATVVFKRPVFLYWHTKLNGKIYPRLYGNIHLEDLENVEMW